MCFPARQRLSGFGLAKLTCYWLSQGSGESGKRDRGGGWGWRRGKGRGAARNSWGHACLAVSLALRASQAMVPDHWQPVTELNHVSGLCPGLPQFSWPSGSCRLNLSPAHCELAGQDPQYIDLTAWTRPLRAYLSQDYISTVLYMPVLCTISFIGKSFPLRDPRHPTQSLSTPYGPLSSWDVQTYSTFLLHQQFVLLFSLNPNWFFPKLTFNLCYLPR